MANTEFNIRRIDSMVRDRATYVHDRVDRWRSYAKELKADPNFQLEGDCDDWAQTTLHLLQMEGIQKRDLFRAIVISKGSNVPDHMIGIVRLDDSTYMTVGDTFGPPNRVSLNNHDLIDARTANGHRIVAVAPLTGLLWRGRLKRKANTANRGMAVSDRAIAEVKAHEQFRAEAYDDFRPFHKLKPGDEILGTLTIGYGHTGPDVKIGMVITEAQAEALLKADLAKAADAVMRLVDVQLDQGAFDALVVFVFNVGEGNFSTSTLLKLVNKQAPEREIHAQFRRWIKSKGKVMGGLISRREAEIRLWGFKGGDMNAVKLNVQAEGIVQETTRLIDSKTILATSGQFVLGALLFVSQLGQLAPDLQAAGEQSGLPWLTAAASFLMTASSVALFLYRAYQIKVQANQ